MHSDLRWLINDRRVAHRIIEDEAMIIDFDTGFYYALDNIGARIWAGLAQNLTFQEMVRTIEQAYDGDHDVISAAISDFLSQLQTESLIVPAAGASVATGPGLADQPVPSDYADRPHFTVPLLAKYTDMHDLLLLDPIHEVDEGGWPMPGQPSKRAS